MKTYRGVDVYVPVFLTSALVRDELLASHSGRFIPGKEPPLPIEKKLGEPQGRSGRQGEVKILNPTGSASPILPDRFHSLHRLVYRGCFEDSKKPKYIHEDFKSIRNWRIDCLLPLCSCLLFAI
jgi:hypothetical protein